MIQVTAAISALESPLQVAGGERERHSRPQHAPAQHSPFFPTGGTGELEAQGSGRFTFLPSTLVHLSSLLLPLPP